MKRLLLILILFLAGVLRFNNLNWDEGHHLHPDERFLTMVATSVKTPGSFSAYLDPRQSTMNPANVGHQFYVYGNFPLTFIKLISVWTQNDSYTNITIVGRAMSGAFDLLIVILVYKIILLLLKKEEAALWGAFLYAISVLPIQLSHFFAVDTFLSFFMTAAFYFALRFYYDNKFRYLVPSSIFFGLAVASKISAIYIIPLIAFLMITVFVQQLRKQSKDRLKKILIPFAGMAMVYILLSYLSLRLASPYYFESTNIFDPHPSTLFMNNLKVVGSYGPKDVYFPPAVQWIHKPPVLFSLTNMAFFGLGIPYFILLVLGLIYTVIWNKRNGVLIVLTVWTVGFFTYQSFQFVKAMRYFIFIYPFLAVIAGLAAYHLVTPMIGMIAKKPARVLTYGLVILALLIWPLAFSSIYVEKNSRVAASEWLYANLPNNSHILWEYWDDPLPLLLPGQTKTFTYEHIGVFDPDTPQKWNYLNASFQKADYYILSSNRAWGSIPTVPEAYPQMSKYYKDLFGGKLAYKKVKEFTSYPSLRYLGIPLDFPDQWSDESFTVYDHPMVMIFKNAAK